MKRKHTISQETEERPAGYQGPDFDPEGLVLEPHELGKGKPVVLVCSGFMGLNRIHPARFARALTDLGYVCFGFDCRGFGKSGGEPGRVFLREQIRDIENAGIYLSLQDEAEGKDIVLVGWGMGAGLLLEAADEVPRQAGLVSINGFCNGRRLFSPPLKNGPTPRPVPPQFLFRFAGCGSSFP